jgi:hypothetical protein
MNSQHLIHCREINADAALDCKEMALDRAARTIGNHGHMVLAAKLNHRGNILGTLRKYDRIGGLWDMD